MESATQAVPRIGRVLDLVGLVFVLAGAGFVLRARAGYGEVQAYVPQPDDPPMAAMALADTFYLAEKVGAGMIVMGVGVFVAAWWVARTRAAGSQGLADH